MADNAKCINWAAYGLWRGSKWGDLEVTCRKQTQDKLRITNCCNIGSLLAACRLLFWLLGFWPLDPFLSLFCVRMRSGHISTTTKRTGDMAIREFISPDSRATGRRQVCNAFCVEGFKFWSSCDFINLRFAGATVTGN